MFYGIIIVHEIKSIGFAHKKRSPPRPCVGYPAEITYRIGDLAAKRNLEGNMKAFISNDELVEFKQDFQKDRANILAMNAVCSGGLNESANTSTPI